MPLYCYFFCTRAGLGDSDSLSLKFAYKSTETMKTDICAKGAIQGLLWCRFVPEVREIVGNSDGDLG